MIPRPNTAPDYCVRRGRAVARMGGGAFDGIVAALRAQYGDDAVEVYRVAVRRPCSYDESWAPEREQTPVRAYVPGAVARLRCRDAGIGVTVARSGRCAVVVDADDAPDVIPAVRRVVVWRRCDALAAARGLTCVQTETLPGAMRHCVYAACAVAAPSSLSVVIDAWGDVTWFDAQGCVVAISDAR